MTAIQLPDSSKYRRDGRFQAFDAGAKVEKGYQINVAARKEDAQRIAHAVLPWLCRQGINHRVLADTDFVADQEQKFIAVYPRTIDQAREVAERLSSALVHLEGGRPQPIGVDAGEGSLKLPGSAFVSVRYDEHRLADGKEAKSQVSEKLFKL